MDNIYGWYPSKREGKLIFEFVDNNEFIVNEDFIEDREMLDELHEIQSKIDDFHSRYLEDKPKIKWGD